eukprot:TRINITY_DN3796_c0_g1_i1.p1 TRINITY_DN3796_c0_g1~~TRINITY_DN3796_c0_g1_i1.p1  ORF type:complete len:297 (-),score=54.08 TRINITY_DN3796_c0_g1_i1:51-941(-)
MKFEPRDSLSLEQKDSLEALRVSIDNVLETIPEKRGAMVRLSTRSPKDAALASTKVKEILKKELEARPHADTGSAECYTDDSIAYWRSVSKANHIISGAEALELLLHSNRVSDDIRWTQMHLKKWSMQLVVREWEEIEPELELRAFITKGKLTCFTQYHRNCFVPSLWEHREQVKKLVIDEFEKVHPLVVDMIPDQSYTLDFVLNKDFTSIRVVEINDPPPTAGTSLFLWDSEEDRNIIWGKTNEQIFPVVRLLDRPYPWALQEDIHPPLKQLIEEIRGRAAPPESKSERSLCLVC